MEVSVRTFFLLLLSGCSAHDAAVPTPAEAAPVAPAPTEAAPAAPDIEALQWVEAPSTTVDAPVVVILHGLGASPESILDLLDGYPGALHKLAPRGPLPYGTGWSWFPLTAAPSNQVEYCLELRQVADRLAEGMRARGIGSEHEVVVTGFSQGGILSFAMALNHPELVDLAVPIGGWLPEPCIQAGPAPKNAPPIRAFHGGADQRLPVEPVRGAVTVLQDRGWDASISIYDGVGHHVSPEMRADVFSTLQAQLAR